MINREEALKLIHSHVKNEGIVKHMFALEAVMGALYDRLVPTDGSTRDQWCMAGLIHDADYVDEVPANLQGVTVINWAKDLGYEIPDNLAHATAAHNWHNTGVEPANLMDWSIFCADSLTGLITASALVLPTKKLADVKLSSVLKRFKEPSFAKGTRRDEIALCQQKLGLSLPDFVSISLVAMQGIASELGL
jgi:uncharacterized protein